MDYEISTTQAKFMDMELHMERMMYMPWFARDLSEFLGTVADLRKIRHWLGDPGRFYMIPGVTKKYVTLVFRYDNHLVAYEQNSLGDRTGVCRELIVPS
jgi:hypothetical protein